MLNNISTKNAICYLIFLGCVALTNCAGHYRPAQFKTLRHIGLLYSFPISFNGGEFEYLKDSLSIYYQDSVEIYSLPIKNSISIGDSVIQTDVKFQYFVRKVCDSVGLFIADKDKDELIYVSADSILNSRALNSFKLFSDTNRILVSKERLDRNQTFSTFRLINQNVQYPIDSVYLVFNQGIKPFCYSFSPHYDALGGGKLVKVILIQNQVGTPYSANYIPKRTTTMALFEKHADDTGSIAKVLKKYYGFKK